VIGKRIDSDENDKINFLFLLAIVHFFFYFWHLPLMYFSAILASKAVAEISLIDNNLHFSTSHLIYV